MQPSHGWIKLYRCLLADPLWQCGTPEQKVILVTLLLMANHAETKWQWQGKPYLCRPGQMITSLKSIEKTCGRNISVQKIRTALDRFEKMGFLNRQCSKQNTLITICNWSAYQNPDGAGNKDDDTPLTHTSHTPDTQLTPNKNVKNEKKEKKLPPGGNPYLSFEEQDRQRIAAANDQALQAFLAAGNDTTLQENPAGKIKSG